MYYYKFCKQDFILYILLKGTKKDYYIRKLLKQI